MQQTQSPLLRLWQLGKDHHGGLIAAIFCAVAGVLLGLLPYLSAGRILVALLTGQRDWNFYLLWCMVALGGYLAKTLLYNLALSLSHKATFQILRDIRKMVLSKMPRLPLGDILDTSSGRLKQIVVDQVESMETTLAHLLPEMTSNLLAPVCVLVYLFTLDWRMALLSLVSIPVGMAFMMAIMGSYGKDYQGAVETTQAMNETIVEYIGGIEVIKAFNQGKNSYEKFSSRVRANAAYYYNWMKKCQFGMALAYAIAPTTLITVLPVGWIFYTDGSLSAEVFLTTIILSMSIVGPLIAAMGFVDNLAKVGYHRGFGGRDPPEAGAGSRNTAGTAGKTGYRLGSCLLWVCPGQGDPPQHLPHHSGRQPHRFGWSLRFGQVHHCQAHRRFLGCDRGPHYPGRRGGKPYPAGTTL